MTQSIQDRIAAAESAPRTIEVEVCHSGGLVNLHAELVDELAGVIDEMNKNRSVGTQTDPRVAEIHDQIGEVEAAMAEHSVTYQVAPIGALAWNNLLRQHAPRPGVDKGLAYNLETFPPAVVAACVTDEAFGLDEATDLYNRLSSAEWNKLFNAAWVANEGETPRPKLPAAIESLLQNVRSSTTAATED